MKLTVIDTQTSNILRKKYISTFVNTESRFYIDRIQTLKQFSDGMCYTGYLWDCLKKPTVIPAPELAQKLKSKKGIYIMWDNHSADNIFVPNYWKYPKDCLLYAETWSDDMYQELPEDIYIFDDSFTWSAVLTHEIDLNNEPYCLYMN